MFIQLVNNKIQIKNQKIEIQIQSEIENLKEKIRHYESILQEDFDKSQITYLKDDGSTAIIPDLSRIRKKCTI